MRRLLPAAVLLTLLLAASAQAQELNCRVTVDYGNLGGTDFDFLDDLQEEIEEYLNERSWTEDRFEEYERINCTFAVELIEAEGLSRFRAQVVVSGQRPIFGSPVRTTTFQVLDNDWTFDYNRGQPLIFDLNRFNNLASLVDFYAFLILGYDYDTFAELGGAPHFEQARRIAELARSQGGAEWQSIGEDQSRATLIRQLLDPRFERLRRAYFLYHFGGLDRFTTDFEEGWEAANGAITEIYELFVETSRRYAIDVFFTAKAPEIGSLFEDYEERAGLYALLVEMDPARTSQYDRLAQ